MAASLTLQKVSSSRPRRGAKIQAHDFAQHEMPTDRLEGPAAIGLSAVKSHQEVETIFISTLLEKLIEVLIVCIAELDLLKVEIHASILSLLWRFEFGRLRRSNLMSRILKFRAANVSSNWLWRRLRYRDCPIFNRGVSFCRHGIYGLKTQQTLCFRVDQTLKWNRSHWNDNVIES